MSEYLPLEKSGGRARPPKTKAVLRKVDITTPARRPQGPAVLMQRGGERQTVDHPGTKRSPEASLKRMLANRQIQAKLTLGPVGDQYEQEADTVAGQVVNRLSDNSQPTRQPAAQRQEEEEMAQPKRLHAVQRQEEEEMMAKRLDTIQRQEEEEEMIQPQRQDTVQRQEEEEEMMQPKRLDVIQRQEEEEEMMQPKRIDSLQRQEEEEMMAKRLDSIQRQAVLGAEGGEITPEFEESIQGARSSGQPLGDNVRGPMENAFGADFSGVKVHTDSQSDSMNQSIQARAFTTGQDIFFRGGEYSPGSSGGQELLAHELTHVVQQNGPAVQQKREE